jgi:hypothetical protein
MTAEQLLTLATFLVRLLRPRPRLLRLPRSREAPLVREPITEMLTAASPRAPRA